MAARHSLPSVLTSHCSRIRLPTEPSIAALRSATVTATSAPPSNARGARYPEHPFHLLLLRRLRC
jgi:hypothetical protein